MQPGDGGCIDRLPLLAAGLCGRGRAGGKLISRAAGLGGRGRRGVDEAVFFVGGLCGRGRTEGKLSPRAAGLGGRGGATIPVCRSSRCLCTDGGKVCNGELGRRSACRIIFSIVFEMMWSINCVLSVFFVLMSIVTVTCENDEELRLGARDLSLGLVAFAVEHCIV